MRKPDFDQEERDFLADCRASRESVDAWEVAFEERRKSSAQPFCATLYADYPGPALLARCYSDGELMLYVPKRGGGDDIYTIHGDWRRPLKLLNWLSHLLRKNWFTKNHAVQMITLADNGWIP